MFKTLSIIISTALLTMLYACAKQGASLDSIITAERVAETVQALSADELKGRKAGSPEAKRAAGIIAAAFKEANLSYLPGLSSYEQSFTVAEHEVLSMHLELNGTEVAPDNFWIHPGAAPVAIGDITRLRQIHLGPALSIRDTLGGLIDHTEPLLVTIDAKHAPWLSRLRGYFAQITQLQGGSKAQPAPVIMVLTEGEITQGSAQVELQTRELHMQNVAGVLQGASRPEEYVIFSAHYDHIGILDAVEGDSIANGADDDASGTTAVMHLARYFSQQQAPARSILFVAFTAEEIGGYGSQYFSQQVNPESVMAMFNIEMIGKPSKFGPNTAFITGFDKSDFGIIVQEATKGTAFQYYPDPYPDQNLFYRSDNATLARLGVPAHTISTDQIDIDPYYHTVDDEYGTLDLEHMAATIRGIALGAEVIIAGEATPSRVAKE